MSSITTPAQWNLRIQHQYEEMCHFPINSLFSWKVDEGQNPPTVRSYLVTYRIKTMVMDHGRLKPQFKTVVRIRLPESPDRDPTAHVVEGLVPYHPNWYDNGRLCNGDMWVKDPILWKYVLKIGHTLAFDPGFTNIHSPANSKANADWIAKMNRRIKPYPCGKTDFPHPIGM